MSEFGNIWMSKSMNLAIDPNLAGCIVRLTSNVEAYSINSEFSTINAGSTVMLTGYRDTLNGGYQLEDDLGWFALIDDNNSVLTGQRATYSQSTANKVVKEALTDDYYIMKNLLILSACWNKLTTYERDVVHYLYRRLCARQYYYQNDNDCLYNKQTAVVPQSPALTNLHTVLNSYTPTNVAPVGVVLTTVAINVTAIVIAALVAAAAITTAVLVYKWWGKEAADDRVLSDKTVKLLKDKGLTEEEIEQIVRETNGAVTKAEIKAKLGTTFGIAKIALIGAGAFFVYKTVKVFLQKKQKKNASAEKTKKTNKQLKS